MAKELIVSVNGREKKIAIVENDKVTEFYIERGETEQGIVGNIYKGRVMRVLPGMQSAFVNVGLERDAFLYVSDFFDEEEEFERIVIDKSKKGESGDVERAAAEQVAQGRVEREQQIDAAQEKVEPLIEVEDLSELTAEREVETAGSTEVDVDADQAGPSGKRRGRRGRRRGRGQDGEEPQPQTPTLPREVLDTPFAAGDPSIQRIIDDEEAAVNGEMFKDARLQERLFDQIHAGEFNLGEDLRTAEVGSLLPSNYGDSSFQRIDDDSEVSAQSSEMRSHETVAAHIHSFSDEADEPLITGASFERVSDEDEGSADEDDKKASKKAGAKAREKKKRGGPKAAAAPAKPATKKAGTKKVASKRRTKASAESEGESAESSGNEHGDAEARVTDNNSRAEFATRRGGRRRRRPAIKPKSEGDGSSAPEVDEETEVTAAADESIIEQSAPEPVQAAPATAPERPQQREERGGREGRDQREHRDQRDNRDRRPQGNRGNRNIPRRERHQPTITDLLKEGQEILVQIAKEPIAKKGARITSHIALPGRFLVYMPTVEHVGVSRKIDSDGERHRLRKLIQVILASEDIPSGGFIVRTAGVGINESEMREDVRYLVRTWLDIRAAAEKAKPATMVHKDLDLVQRILRDQLSDDFAAIRVDSEEEYERIVEFVNRIQPRMVKRVKLYTRETPILEAYAVQAEIDKAIKPRVWLKSGGYLVINQTEALVSIDVNTGKFVGRGSGRLEDTITRTNLEAVEEIVRQIRLRDLGGIIVLDLIDMEERRNRQRVMQTLQDALRDDKSPTKVLSFNDFGLVIMTRKRVKQSLERTLCSPCQVCQGAGLVKSPQTVCYEILEEARRLARSNGSKSNQVILRTNPEVARTLRGAERDVLNGIEDYLGPIDITSDPAVHQEQFDFALS
jgi:Rne/Rng family ribonuclease